MSTVLIVLYHAAGLMKGLRWGLFSSHLPVVNSTNLTPCPPVKFNFTVMLNFTCTLPYVKYLSMLS
jgi:hypothetical protein